MGFLMTMFVSWFGVASIRQAQLLRAKAMRNLTRVNFMGQAADPSVALSNADIFLYPLQRDHYGTAE